MRSRMEEEDETLRQNHQAQMNALNETQQAQLDDLRAGHKKALEEQELQARKRSEELLVAQSKELAALLGVEQTDLIEVVRSQIFEHRSMRAEHQIHQQEILAQHCAALIGLTKHHQQLLAEDLHARHAMQLAFCEKDKKHTIDKNTLLKSHETDNEWLKKQQESMSQRSDQTCREKEAKLVDLQNQQMKSDAEYAKKQLDNIEEKLRSEHERILRFVTETLRSNTIADTTIELPQYTVPSLTDIVPDYNSTEQSYHPPVARAPPAPITTTSHRSQPSSGSADDGSIPPPSRPPPQHPVSP